MPAIRMAGRKWRVSSDFVPIFACVSLVFHAAWVVVIIVWPFAITQVHKCDNSKAGREFLSSVWLFFILYVTSALQEILIIIIGLRGTPLETRKRKAMIPVLYTQTANWIGQIGAVAYGTYVEHRYSGSMVTTDCSSDSVVMLKVLVFTSWVMIAFNWSRLLVIYNLFPDYENIESWAKRIRLYTWYSRNKGVVSHLQAHQHRPLGRLAELYSRLLHGADLSPSDELISLILLSAAQRKTRQEHIRKAIDAHREQKARQQQHQQPQLGLDSHSCGKADPPPPSHAAQHGSHADLTEQVNDSAYMSDDSSRHSKSSSLQSISPDKPANPGDSQQDALSQTLSTIHTPNAADDCDLLGKHSQQQRQDQRQAAGLHNRPDNHVTDTPRQSSKQASKTGQHQQQQQKRQTTSKPHEDATIRMLEHLKVMEEGRDINTAQGNAQEGNEQGGNRKSEADGGGDENACGGMSTTDRKSSRRHLNQDHFFHRDFMLAPSAFASEYDPDTAPDELADIYTGKKERASRADVTEASRFAKYAIAAYGAAGFQYLHSTSKVKNTYQLLNNRGQDAYKANKLMADKITTLEQHLDYEAIIQIAEIDDQDLLYLNFDNQALGDLPYVLALDRPTKSVVVAIRGTVTVADLATDMLADPEPMEEWLPRKMKTTDEVDEIAPGPRRAHAGIMSAATAIWKDLRAHRILPAMLDVSDDSSEDDSDNEQYDIASGDNDEFEEVFGPDDQPVPNPEDQRLPYADESPGAHHKEEPHHPRACQQSRRHKMPKRNSRGLESPPKDQRPSPRKQGSGMEHNAGRHPSPHKEPVATVKPVHTLNPINVVGKVLKAGASVAQEVPNQALGRAMGAAGGPRSRHHLTPPRAEVQTQDEATAVEDELSYGSHQAAAVGDGRQSSQHQAAAGAKNDRSNPAADRDVHDASRQPQSSNSSHHSPHGQDSEPSGWDKSVQQGRVKHSKSKVSSSGNSREVNRPSVSDGSLSKKETGPMQYIYSRGGKLAATFAMAMASKKGNPAGASNSTSQSQDQHRDQQNQANQAGDVEMGNAAPRNGSATDNNNSMPGSDTVSKHGAGDPNAAAGGQAGRGLEHQDSSTREKYAAEIVRRGLNKEGWKLVITGHSLGAGAAALIALKLRNRYPMTKCWAFCPPGGLLTPNLAHAMKPFCTSLVVNKDCIPRMSLKNLNRFMEGKLMALACSKMNAFQIFFSSYGKVNRRAFFDKDIFRPFTDIPEEAKEMLDRFQECTLTDVSAQDMVPPGRVMYLRRFKASPRASVAKQAQHRRNARSSKHIPNATNLPGLRQLANSASGSSNEGNDSSSTGALRRLRDKLPGSLTHKHRNEQQTGEQSKDQNKVHDVENQITNANQSSPHRQQQLQTRQGSPQHGMRQEASGRLRMSREQQDSEAEQHANLVQQDQHSHEQDQHSREQDQHQHRQDEADRKGDHQEGDWWTKAGLQKPPKEDEDDEDCGLCKLCSPKCLHCKRKKKQTLKQALQNPTDLFWDAVWIEPEDIIREGLLVSPKMTEDHYTVSLLRSLKAVGERLAEQEGKQGSKETQGSSQVAAADRSADSNAENNEGDRSGGGIKEATLGGIFDLV